MLIRLAELVCCIMTEENTAMYRPSSLFILCFYIQPFLDILESLQNNPHMQAKTWGKESLQNAPRNAFETPCDGLGADGTH